MPDAVQMLRKLEQILTKGNHNTSLRTEECRVANVRVQMFARILSKAL